MTENKIVGIVRKPWFSVTKIKTTSLNPAPSVSIGLIYTGKMKSYQGSCLSFKHKKLPFCKWKRNLLHSQRGKKNNTT